MRPATATLIVNCAAHRVAADFDPTRPARFLEKRGLGVTLVLPDSGASTTAAAAAAAGRGDRLVFVVGGDGSLRDAARGLAGSETALAAVPAGTVNVFARETGIPIGVRAALEAHLDGQVVPMDLGRAGDEPFLLMAGVGWDAEVTKSVSHALKRRVGDLAYVVRGARLIGGLRPRPVSWAMDGADESETPLSMLVLSNTRLYGGRVRFAPAALATDGLLDIAAVGPRSAWAGARAAASLLRASLEAEPSVTTGRACAVSVSTPGLAVQLDGDYVLDTPCDFRVERGALSVSVPAGPLPAILRE